MFVVIYSKEQKVTLDVASGTDFITCPLVMNIISLRGKIQLKGRDRVNMHPISWWAMSCHSDIHIAWGILFPKAVASEPPQGFF